MNPSTSTSLSPSPADLTKSRLSRPVWERILDYGISILALLALMPLFLLVIVTIKLVSSGPILFRQKRIGYNGSPFTIYKFRTMHVNAETASHASHTSELIKSNRPMIKLDGADRRIIPCGTIMRALGIDEFPQIINVLKGEMSIVGPRPSIPTEYAEYSKRDKKRLSTLPGLTGLWQVSGKNRLTFDQMIDCDIQYSLRKSIGLYLWIILKTPVVLAQQTIESRRPAEIAEMPVALDKRAVGQ